MSKRIVTSIILGFVVIAAIIFYPIYGIIVVFFTIVALYEFFYMVEKKGVRLFKPLGIIVGALIQIGRASCRERV